MDTTVTDEMRAIGDRMQSNLSRIAEYVDALPICADSDYEVRVAAFSAKRDIEAWTALRRSEARS